MIRLAAEFPIAGIDVQNNSLRISPIGESFQRDVPSRFLVTHSGIKALSGFIADIFEILLQGADTGFVGNWTMTWNHGLHVPCKNRFARPNPIVDRSSPYHRMPADEQNVAGEYGSVRRNIYDDVTSRVRRTELPKADFLAADA